MNESTEITIRAVAPAELIAHWEVVGPMLDRAMPVILQRFLSIDVLAMCIAGGAQGWLVHEGDKILAVMITRIETYPRRRGLSIFALSGERMPEWFAQANEIISDYARRAGCQFMEVQGRKGWQKVLDLEPRSIFLVKDLTMNATNDDGGAML